MKYALILANNKYEDSKLAQLKTPEADARALTMVLKAKNIGHFDEVKTLINPTEVRSRRAINAFLANKKPDDLVLVYFSGHGVLDDRGSLFLAVKDTQIGALSVTAIPSNFISSEMDNCRSRRQILILDCCHSGAFGRGAKGEQKAITQSTFEGSGSGRVVLTASDSTQLAFEGDRVIGETRLSLFTHFLLEGLKTGEADLNNDGRISLDEWYDYCHSRITATTPKQIPHKWSYRQQGDLIIANNPFRRKPSAAGFSHPLREMLDQKLLDYRQHRLLLDSRELEIISAELEQANLELGAADKRLFLFSALAHGGVERWMELSGDKGLEWLREACHDDNSPQEVRHGAAAYLGGREDRDAYDHLLDCLQQETELTKRKVWLDLLTNYLNSSEQTYRLPWAVKRTVFPRLVSLRFREGVRERTRMSRIAGYLAPVCVLITYGSIWLSPSNTLPPPFLLGGAVFNIIIAIILAITFAWIMTALASVTFKLRFPGRAIILAGAGSLLGSLLFLALAGYGHVWFAGGIIGLIMAISQSDKNKRFTLSLTVLSAIVVFAAALFVLEMKTSAENLAGYAFSASLFSGVYLFFACQKTPQQLTQPTVADIGRLLPRN